MITLYSVDIKMIILYSVEIKMTMLYSVDIKITMLFSVDIKMTMLFSVDIKIIILYSVESNHQSEYENLRNYNIYVILLKTNHSPNFLGIHCETAMQWDHFLIFGIKGFPSTHLTN